MEQAEPYKRSLRNRFWISSCPAFWLNAMTDPSPREQATTARAYSSALITLINEAQQSPESDQALQLYAHRLAKQPGFWQTDNTSQDHKLEEKLVRLIQHYVRHLPILLEHINEDCQRLNWHAVADKANRVIDAYCEKNQRRSQPIRFIDLLDKVYFSHRLLEELHDHLMCALGSPSIPWNMTAANILMHQVLGAEFSSRLDETAIELVERLMAEAPPATVPQAKKSQTSAWPCFCAEHGLSLAF